MSNHILEKFIDTIPSSFKPGTNQVILALLTAISESDEFLETQTQNAKDQLFVRTATGPGLDRIANSLGVSRPSGLGLEDSQFQLLVPALSLHPKQIKKIFYTVGDVFWGPLFSRANLTTANKAPFNLSIGDELKLTVDNGIEQLDRVRAGDVTIPGAATAAEVKTWLERVSGISVEILIEPGTGDESINLRTNTPGSAGTLEVISSSAIGTGKLELLVGSVDILDLAQRFVVYNVNPNELIIEVPAIVPSLRRTLLGSHHFHADATIELPKPTTNGIWQGSFLHNPSGSEGAFSISGQRTTLLAPILAGDVLTTISVADSSQFLNNSGSLIFDFGKSDQEFSVIYQGIINASTVAVDPSHTFANTHLVGSNVNVLNGTLPLVPRKLGGDYAVYLPSPSAARAVVQNILEKLKAAGIILKFIVLAPDYRYRISNPYLDDQNTPC